jgi:hypothetical protein
MVEIRLLCFFGSGRGGASAPHTLTLFRLWQRFDGPKGKVDRNVNGVGKRKSAQLPWEELDMALRANESLNLLMASSATSCYQKTMVNVANTKEKSTRRARFMQR